jgi:hypothetical protein
MRYENKFLVLKSEGKRMLGEPDHRWENNNIKLNLKEILSELGPSFSKQGQVVNSCEYSAFRFHQGNFLTSWTIISFSTRTLLHGVN